MKEIRTILVVLDRSARDKRVVARALFLARHFGARLELFLCDAEHEYAFRRNYDDRGNAEGRKRCVADAEAYLTSVKEALQAPTLTVEVSACCESPLYEGILGKVREQRPDLVLKSPDCDRSGGGLPFSDNDWMLASNCPAPVMFVGPRDLVASTRIAAAVDASPRERPGLARAILDLADSIRARVNGQLEVIACVPVPREEVQHAYARKFNDLVSDFRLGERGHLLSGEPEAVLPSFASARAYDILVMGALSHRAAPAPVIGSLTGKLIGALDCDFVLVKPDTLALRRTQSGG